eukprot:SAG31_NODE_1602_length_7780_cov_8.304699_9_plen_39_part_00
MEGARAHRRRRRRGCMCAGGVHAGARLYPTSGRVALIR